MKEENVIFIFVRMVKNKKGAELLQMRKRKSKEQRKLEGKRKKIVAKTEEKN